MSDAIDTRIRAVPLSLRASRAAANARTITAEIDWLAQILDARYRLHFGDKTSPMVPIEAIAPPDVDGDVSDYAELVRRQEMNFAERLVLILALVPHVRPERLDPLLVTNSTLGRRFTEFGGWLGKTHGGFLPTAETALFLLAGDEIERRFELLPIFSPEHYLQELGILRLERASADEPFGSAVLTITTDYLHRLTTGHDHRPATGTGFPARRITTRLTWTDLVLPREAMAELRAIRTWIEHSLTITRDWGFGRVLKPGFRSLFHGPPGTGKTLAATMLGTATGFEVYCIDLSMVVSKYIGETEKNLAEVFDQARHKHWILFFDEADALFGKRTQTSSSNDRYANQEVSYLLQRVEDFPGIVILATNLKTNIDEAFARRFQSLVYFSMPDAEARLRIWRGVFPDPRRLAEDVDLERLAETAELAGGAIINVVRCAATHALQHGRERIGQSDLLLGIAKELRKEGKSP